MSQAGTSPDDSLAGLARILRAFAQAKDWEQYHTPKNLAMALAREQFTYYNFGGPHKTLTKRHGTPTTPAMAAGVADHVWDAGRDHRTARPGRHFKLTHYRTTRTTVSREK